MTTKFEVGKVYRTRNGRYRLRVTGSGRNVVACLDDDPSAPGDWYFNADGEIDPGKEDDLDLVLPAIEAEGAPAAEPLSPWAKESMEGYRNFWMNFAKEVREEITDPTDQGEWPDAYAVVTIACAYESHEAALAEADRIAAMLDRLLEGQSHD